MSWTLTKKLAQKRSRAERWFWAKERVGLLLLQLFPKGGATDTVFVTLSVLHNGRDSNCVVLWSLRNAGRTLPQYPVVLAAVHGSLGLPGWRLFRGFTPLSPFSHSSPSLIGLLASVDVKQQKTKGRGVSSRTRFYLGVCDITVSHSAVVACWRWFDDMDTSATAPSDFISCIAGQHPAEPQTSRGLHRTCARPS